MNIPGGLPGTRKDGLPSKPNDRASGVRAAFKYQDFALYIEICQSLKTGAYAEFWTEHHEDFIGVTTDGFYDVFQVKTRQNEGDLWIANDQEFSEILEKFIALSRRENVRSFYVYSNVDPYVPAEHAKRESTFEKSIKVLQKVLKDFSDDELSDGHRKVLRKLEVASGGKSHEIREVLSRLNFKKGPSLTRFSDNLHEYISNVDVRISRLKIKEIKALELKFLAVIDRASTTVHAADRYASPVQENGASLAEIHGKRLRVHDFKRIVDSTIAQHRRQRWYWVCLSVVCVVVMAKLLAPHFGKSALALAVENVKSARENVLPAEFSESVAIIRSSGKALDGLDLRGANLECQDLSQLDVRRLDGSYLRATGISFDKSNLVQAYLSNAELNMSKFRKAKMLSSDFSGANLLAANFFGAEARFSNFEAATLQGANLDQGDFSSVNFKKAQFNLAELRKADFQNSNFKDASLADADISGSDFRGAKIDPGNNQRCMLRKSCSSNIRQGALAAKKAML
jgi:uncharacterized protein YjbI with pentapeptide repeats